MRALSVLLVDDEEIVRRGLSELVDWDELNLSLAGTAVHGREALNFIQRQPVDIVVTDVLMPELDGLGLIQEAASLEHSPKFIVLSGYNEFEFARRAMSLGVRHYVLKPTQLDELKRSLREVSEQIHQDERIRTQLAAAEQGDSAADPMVRQGMLRQLLVAQRSGSGARDVVRRLWGEEAAADETVLVVIDLGMLSPMKREADVELVVKRSFRADELRGTVTTDSYVVIFLAGGNPEQLKEQTELLATRLEALAGPELRVALTPPAPAAELAGRYEAAASQLQCAFYRDEMLIAADRVTAGISDDVSEAVAAALDDVRGAVKLADGETARNALARAADEAAKSMLRPSVFKAQCVELLVQLAADGTADIWERVKGYVSAIQAARSCRELQTALSKAFELMLSEFASLTASPQERMVRTLQSAVKNRYAENDLSLTKLTESVVHGNVDYVGRVFRQLAGIRFTEFLIQVRMEEAKRLLREFPQMPVREIARQVGYGNNAQYFSYSFHRYEGVTPSAYRSRSAG